MTLTAEQYAPIIARLTDQRDYLTKLLERMKANQFPPDDPLLIAITAMWQSASNACVVACTCRNKQHRAMELPKLDTIMTQAPWGGNR